MVDADDGQRCRVLVVLDFDGNGGFFEGGVDGVDGEWVVRVGGVAGHVDNDSKVAASLGEEVVVDEGGDRLGEVDLGHVSAPRDLGLVK